MVLFFLGGGGGGGFKAPSVYSLGREGGREVRAFEGIVVGLKTWLEILYV